MIAYPPEESHVVPCECDFKCARDIVNTLVQHWCSIHIKCLQVAHCISVPNTLKEKLSTAMKINSKLSNYNYNVCNNLRLCKERQIERQESSLVTGVV